MNKRALSNFNTRKTPQRERIPGDARQVQNNAKGYVFEIEPMAFLRRFLVLGTGSGTYYVNAKKHTENAINALIEIAKSDGKTFVDETMRVSVNGLAKDNTNALFALAVALSYGDKDTKEYAVTRSSDIARIPTHWFTLFEFLDNMRGRGAVIKRLRKHLINILSTERLGYYAAKYPSRGKWSMRDFVRIARPKARDDAQNSVLRYIVKGEFEVASSEEIPEYMRYIVGKNIAPNVSENLRADHIRSYKLTHEMIPTEWKNDPAVWEALLETMPLHAMVRGLNQMSAVGLLTPFSNATNLVIERLNDTEYIQRSRMHPFTLLVAMRAYMGGSNKNMQWDVVSRIVDALDDAYYKAFQNVESSGKRIQIAIDVSGSMSMIQSRLGLTPNPRHDLYARDAAAAIALPILAVEPNAFTTIFSAQGVNPMKPVTPRYSAHAEGISTYSLSTHRRLDDVVREMSTLDFGATDCALPMLYAIERKMELDAFVILTDNETWFGSVHPVQALKQYREQFNPNARLIVVGMTATSFTIAEPGDALSLDIAGMSTDVPQLISDFAAGKI